MVLIDTNVLVFTLLDGPFSRSARALLEFDPEWCSESYVLVELTNVLVTTMRLRGLPLAKAQTVYTRARALVEPGFATIDHAEAMATAHRHGVTAYDARFLTLARELGIKLATEDVKLRRAAPGLTHSIQQALET